MPRRRRPIALTDAACEVDYSDAVRRLSQALPILAEIAKRVEAADAATFRAPTAISHNRAGGAEAVAMNERAGY